MAPLFYVIFCHIVPEMRRMTKKMNDPGELAPCKYWSG